jgi:hypothetical protein
MALEQEDKQAIVNAITAGFEKAAKNQSQSSPSTGSGGGGSGGGTNIKFDKTMEGFAGVLQRGGGKISEVTGAFASLLPTDTLKKFGEGIGGIAGYVEDTQGVFQALSKVGAGLNGNLGDLRTQAARTRMPLDAFANMVANNAQQLTGLGGSVTDGARKFAAMSEAMFSGPAPLIDGFMNMGMSIEEANEFVIKNTELTRRQAMITGMTEMEQVAAAQEMAKNLQIVAKLTGKDAKQMQDQLIERQRDGATQARLRLLEKQGVENAQEAYAGAQAELAKSPKVVGDLMDDLLQTGAPMSEATKNFAATNQEAYALLQKAAEANKAGDVEAAKKYAAEAAAATAKFADSEQGLMLATLAQASDIAQGQADLLEEMAPLIDATAAHMKKIKDSTGQEVTFREAFVDNLKRLKEQTETEIQGKAVGQDALIATNQGQKTIANSVSTINEELGKQIQSNQALLKVFDTIKDSGKFTQEEIDGFVGDLMGVIPSEDLTGIANKMEALLPFLKEQGLVTQETVDMLKKLDAPGTSQEEKEGIRKQLEAAGVLKEGSLLVTPKIQQALSDADAANFQKQDEAGNLEEGSSGGYLGRIWNWMKGIAGYDEGTGGFQNFGKGTAVLAHGMEAIVPKDSVQGQLLSAFPNGLKDVQNAMATMGNKFDPSTMGQEVASAMTSSPATSKMGETSEDSLDNLNQTMLQLVEINRRTLDVASRQLKATKGLDGNVMSSVGI